MKKINLLAMVLAVVITGCSSQHSSLMISPTATVEHESSNLLTLQQSIVFNEAVVETQSNNAKGIDRKTQIAMAIVDAVDDDIEPVLDLQPVNKTIYFEFSSDYVRPLFNPALKENAAYLKRHQSSRVLVVGFTDEKGSVDYNYDLGKRRADNVCKKLIQYGVRPVQLTCESYGETHPADPAHSKYAHARNRRSLLVY